MSKHSLIVVHEESRSEEKWREEWHALTSEQRQRMTVPELIKAMGPLHVNHLKYKEKAPPVISVVHRHENLVGRHSSSFSPVYKKNTWGAIKTLFAWVMR